jgi:hypothetical protein
MNKKEEVKNLIRDFIDTTPLDTSPTEESVDALVDAIIRLCEQS